VIELSNDDCVGRKKLKDMEPVYNGRFARIWVENMTTQERPIWKRDLL